jgi:C-terminal processing protease CtpA/Prc
MKNPGRAAKPAGLHAIRIVEGEPPNIDLSMTCPLQRLLERDKSPLSTKSRLLIIQQAIFLLEQFYVHLPMKRSLYAADPVRQLELLKSRVEEEEQEFDNLAFHRAMAEIMVTLRDLHTQYLLPKPFTDQVALLPFQVEDCVENRITKCLVTWVEPGSPAKVGAFTKGVEIISWNGVPIARALELVADRSGGGNEEARRARGIARLTLRVLAKLPPPDEAWVIVGYKTPEGQKHEIKLWWQSIKVPNAPPVDSGKHDVAGSLGDDLEGVIAGRVRKEQNKSSQQITTKQQRIPLESRFPNIFEAAIWKREFGYIRLRTFSLDTLKNGRDDFVEEFVRLLKLEKLPKTGLILDIRDNPGGDLLAAELLLQALAPRPIKLAQFQVISSIGMAELCAIPKKPKNSPLDFRRWSSSVDRGLETGVTLSTAYPISDHRQVHAQRRIYTGPVVLITNALCYSAADLFAAGFSDNGIGKIIGTHKTTGGGGANVFTYDTLRMLLAGKPRHPDAGRITALKALPRSAGLRVALRRTLRAGMQKGTEIEDLGVRSDCLHKMSRRDILERNADLIEHAARILKKK